MSTTPKRSVCIIQRRLTHYRLPLFENLRTLLQEKDIELNLVVGSCTESEKKKNDEGKLPWATSVETYYHLNDRVCWQPIWGKLKKPALVVVPQENRLLHNHLLVVLPRSFKLAFWGHGANLQTNDPDGLKERFKRWTTRQVDWWFAYTKMSADLVSAAHFPNNRITILENSIDTSELSQHRRSITEDDIHAIRASLHLGDGPVAAFVGSLYSDKRLDFLFRTAAAIQSAIPGFRLLVIGDGPERELVQKHCAENAWIRWVGPRFGREKAAYISTAKILLNPGLVGLGILDSFVCGVPMVTTDCGLHSPEIAYLHSGINGMMTENTLDAYSTYCLSLLENHDELTKLRNGCLESAAKYTVENMAQNFSAGISNCLQSQRH